MLTFLQYIESASSYFDAEHDRNPGSNFKKRYNHVYDKFEVIDTKNNKLHSMHPIEDDADKKIKSLNNGIKEVASNDNVKRPGVIDKIANDNKKPKKIEEVSPPGFEGTVKAMIKNHPEIDNPWRLAWYEKNKGFKSHYTKSGKKKKD